MSCIRRGLSLPLTPPHPECHADCLEMFRDFIDSSIQEGVSFLCHASIPRIASFIPVLYMIIFHHVFQHCWCSSRHVTCSFSIFMSKLVPSPESVC